MFDVLPREARLTVSQVAFGGDLTRCWPGESLTYINP